ncbi:Hypothetical protein NTJ_10145 [Nesidiocoris tenuis]|uniref:Uncharacterized protein n=1 Tax=Nesidiocoris tenuis TaxID=355587 RepID=A0ABN7AYS7_9HEMI|nr:Hypothetical protein NTJ_10145 [Nesidiocoris tenuis]
MLSALKFADHRFPSFDPFFSFRDMDSEIAELRTMTRVTQLRQQIECKQEGSWMSVRDVPDDRSKGGTRKVTTYGRAMRSVTRSFTSDMDFGDILNNGFHDIHRKPDTSRSAEPEAIVEFPDDDDQPSAPRGGVEITEVSENGSDPIYAEEEEEESDPMSATPNKTSPTKKTSVVTLGQGNVVLIDKQDSNFKVTGNSKESILDDDPPQKNFSDKKVKKVEFCKTEVHFAPDSGKVNIVETDEKPPSSQLLRRKKRLKKDVAPAKTVMPKLYFGGAERELFFDNKAKLKVDDEKIKKHSFPVIREPSPLLSTGITSLNQLVRPDSADSWDRLAKNKPYGASSGDYAVPEKVKHDIPTVQTARMDDLRHKKSKIDLPGAQQNITPNKINFVGNVRKDTSHYALPKKKSSRTDLKVAETIIPIQLDTNELQNKPQISYCSEDDAVQISGDKIKKCDIKPEDSAKTSYLGNVSPKLSKLIKNDIQHEFQLKQLEIMRKGRAADVTVLHESRESSPKASDSMPQTTAPIHIQVTPEVPQMKMASSTVISEDNLSSNKKTTSPPQPKPRRISEPVYVNNQVPKNVSRTIKVVQEKEKTPQPRISLTKISIDDSREKRRTSRASTRTSSSSQSDRSPKKTTPVLKPRETPKIREVAHVKPMVKQCPRSTLTRVGEPCRRTRTPSRADTPQDTISRSARRSLIAEKSDVRTKKSKEPLRSFEKVSNGWVGHCIVPLKATKPTTRVTVTTTTTSHSPGASSIVVSSKTNGSKKFDGASESKLSHSSHVTNKFQSKGGTLTVARKQFSLSKEHLKSAKLVKELFNNKDAEQPKPDLPRPRNSEERNSNRQRSSLVTRRRLLYEDSANANRFRRDSEQSDDSVVRADEEVRAYMFSNSKKKVYPQILEAPSGGRTGNLGFETLSNPAPVEPLYSTICYGCGITIVNIFIKLFSWRFCFVSS